MVVPVRAIPLVVLVLVLFTGCVSEGDDDERDPAALEDPDEPYADAALPCDERRPPVAYPWEHQVDDPAKIRCPGHFAVTDGGDGPRADVPVWEQDDWWLYRGDVVDSAGTTRCAEQHNNVLGEEERENLSVYRVRMTLMTCDGDSQPPRERHYTKESVSWAMSSLEGFIRHETLFPLVDGKQWTYMDRPLGNVVQAEVAHDDEYSFGGETLEVWRVELTGEDLQTGERWRQVVWYSENARNKLREEFHKAGVQQYYWQLVDSVDGYGEDPGIL